jgi:hypothetical protein
VDAGYRDLPFPFAPVGAPSFMMRADWNLAQFLAYLRSWSATQRHAKRTGIDAVEAATPELAAAWGDPVALRAARWPFFTRVGRVG